MRLPTLILFFLFARQTFAQDTASHRLVISLSGGAFLPWHPGRNVSESFPYTSTPTGTGIPVSRQFSSSLGSDFPRVAYVGDIMNFEVTGVNHAINLGIGLFYDRSSDDGGYFKTGYARVLSFHHHRFRFQPGIDLYVVLGSQIELGQIDNRGQTLQFLGYTAAPQWTETYSNRSGTYTDTYIADHVSVIYRRDALLIQPKAALSATLGGLILGLQAGWMFQLSQGCILLLQQQDAGGEDRNNIAKIHQPHNGLLNGPYLSLIVGFINRSRHLFGR